VAVLRTRRKVCDDEQVRIPDGSEFHTEGGDSYALTAGGKGYAVVQSSSCPMKRVNNL